MFETELHSHLPLKGKKYIFYSNQLVIYLLPTAMSSKNHRFVGGFVLPVEREL